MARFRKSSHKSEEYFGSQHRFEHWYRDNTIYFITARCRNKFPAFESEAAKQVFWNRFDHHTALHGFTPFVTSLLNNHYHSVGHLLRGEELGKMMQKIHGSVAKLVNDLLPVRLVRFWMDAGHQSYFDGCLRDLLQLRRSYGYTLTQALRHGLVRDWRDYPHTRVNVDLENAIDQALRMHCFLEEVPYARYQKRRLGSETCSHDYDDAAGDPAKAGFDLRALTGRALWAIDSTS